MGYTTDFLGHIDITPGVDSAPAGRTTEGWMAIRTGEPTIERTGMTGHGHVSTDSQEPVAMATLTLWLPASTRAGTSA